MRLEELKYFGLFKDCYAFNEMSENKQLEFLISKKIYVKGKADSIYDEDLVNKFRLDKTQNIAVIGRDFMINKVNYTLNKSFINEVFHAISESFEKNKNIIYEHINDLDISLEMIEEASKRKEFLNDIKNDATKRYQDCLKNKIFKDLHIQNKSNSNYIEHVIKKHLRYDIEHLSFYIFGLNNIHNFETIFALNNFLRLKEILKFCNKHKFDVEESEIEQIDFKKSSIPKSIAMLHVAGFFETEKIKKLDSNKLYQTIAIIIGKDPNNQTDIRSIRGNYNILFSSSEENPVKYTSNTHIKKMEELLK